MDERGRGRTRAALAVLLVSTLLGPASPPAAHAGPRDDKRAVERKIGGARKDLDESSAALQRAAKWLAAADRRLGTTRVQLARTRGQVKAARARDRQMAVRLKAARDAVARSERQLAAAREHVNEQRRQIGQFAGAAYRQQGGLIEVAVVLESRSPNELLDRIAMNRNVATAQRVTIDRLEAARAHLASRRRVLDTLRGAAERRKQEAAANLTRMRGLEASVAKAEAAVEGLVADRRRARDAAAHARQRDLSQYNELLAERRRLQRLLQSVRSGGGGSGVGWTPGNGRLARPVWAPITSQYGMRFHPILHRWKLHDGTDFGASCGTPVRAAQAGRVIGRYFNSGYGNRVIIAHGGSLATTYNHLAGYAVGSGATVGKGQIIGYVGSTGFSTGCHLHFMVLRNGSTVNPMAYL